MRKEILLSTVCAFFLVLGGLSLSTMGCGSDDDSDATDGGTTDNGTTDSSPIEELTCGESCATVCIGATDDSQPKSQIDGVTPTAVCFQSCYQNCCLGTETAECSLVEADRTGVAPECEEVCSAFVDESKLTQGEENKPTPANGVLEECKHLFGELLVNLY